MTRPDIVGVLNKLVYDSDVLCRLGRCPSCDMLGGMLTNDGKKDGVQGSLLGVGGNARQCGRCKGGGASVGDTAGCGVSQHGALCRTIEVRVLESAAGRSAVLPEGHDEAGAALGVVLRSA